MHCRSSGRARGNIILYFYRPFHHLTNLWEESPGLKFKVQFEKPVYSTGFSILMGACGSNGYERNQLSTIAGAEYRYSIYVGEKRGDPEVWNGNFTFQARCDSEGMRECGYTDRRSMYQGY